MANEIAELEQRRYIELEKQRARQGTQTPPDILMEIADLRAKYGPVDSLTINEGVIRPAERRRKLDSDVDFLITMVGSIATRLTKTETNIRNVTIGMLILLGITALSFLGIIIYIVRW